jgi:hypothetical protein
MKREREIMKNAEFVTSVQFTDTDSKTVEDLTVVQGHFVFDGRIRSDQAGRFTTYVNKGELTTHIETNFTVKVVKAKHTQWRDMKACPQKSRIESELTALVQEHLSGEVDWALGEKFKSENTQENNFWAQETTQENNFWAQENTQENKKENESFPQEDTEYDVETERALALEEFANRFPSKYANSIPVTTFLGREAELNKAVAQAAVHKDSNDLLEIPNFLKRS